MNGVGTGKIRCKTRVTLPGTAYKGITLPLKASAQTAIAEAKRVARRELEQARACVEALDKAFKVETVLPHGMNKFDPDAKTKVVKTLQAGDREARELKPFTVTLSYPDYLCDGGEPSTWCSSYDAKDAAHAVELARKDVCKCNDYEPELGADFAVITVFRGEMGGDLNPES